MALSDSIVRLLRVLYVEDDALSMCELRKLLGYSDRTIFSSVAKALQKGYVIRVGRGRYKITRKGKTLVELLET